MPDERAHDHRDAANTGDDSSYLPLVRAQLTERSVSRRMMKRCHARRTSKGAEYSVRLTFGASGAYDSTRFHFGLPMRPFATIATLAACLLHFAAGCCLHHGHAAQGDAAFQPPNLAAVSEGEPIAQAILGEPAPAAPCSEMRCPASQWVTLAPGGAELSKATTNLLPALCAGEQPNDFSALQSGEAIGRGAIALPVRLHLFDRVLLI